MKVRTAVLGAVSALALSAVSATGALATDFSGNVSGDYANLNTGGFNANMWGATGSGVFDVDSDWNVGLDAAYHNLNASGVSVNSWTIDGNAFYHAAQGRAGVVVGYNSSDTGGFGNFHVTNYGVAGDWFAGKMWTLSAKAGAFNGSFSLKGYYVGAAATAYVMPDLGLSVAYDYTHFNHGLNENDWTLQGEWLVSEATPISVYGGYQGTTIHGFGSTSFNTWFVGLRWYCNGDGSTTLVDRQRNGTLGWSGSFSPLITKLF
ncbi:MAG: hypothetical protein HY243_17210 [Proteobacteria bacterium]|nr:hypothetical protein [Pseudomonadota bacterium]